MGWQQELKAQWQASKSAYDADNRLNHAVTCSAFCEEAAILYQITGDRRFFELRNLIVEHGLTDGTGGWRKNVAEWDTIPRPEPGPRVQKHIQNGKTKSHAYAIVATEHAVQAATFEAACKKVQRAYERYRQEVGHLP